MFSLRLPPDAVDVTTVDTLISIFFDVFAAFIFSLISDFDIFFTIFTFINFSSIRPLFRFIVDIDIALCL